MEKESELDITDQWLKDLPLSTENPAFKPEELLVCESCGRKSPPTRASCFYCGKELPVSELQKQFLKPNLRKLESWEKGFNVILFPPGQSPDSKTTAEIANFLGLENENLEKILSSGMPLPVARVESISEAEIISEKLAANHIQNRIIEDQQLKVEISPRRLRGIEFFDDKLALVLFNTDEILDVRFEDLSLTVVGSIFERKIESIESLKRKEKGKILDSSETGTDELMIDIYPKDDFIGYRIESSGFDFSCLKQNKGFVARENIKHLVEKLKSVSPDTKFDSNYSKIRGELGKVWEVEEKSSAGDVNRKSFGKFRRTNITIVDNQSQFTRYSRLQKQIL